MYILVYFQDKLRLKWKSFVPPSDSSWGTSVHKVKCFPTCPPALRSFVVSFIKRWFVRSSRSPVLTKPRIQDWATGVRKERCHPAAFNGAYTSLECTSSHRTCHFSKKGVELWTQPEGFYLHWRKSVLMTIFNNHTTEHSLGTYIMYLLWNICRKKKKKTKRGITYLLFIYLFLKFMFNLCVCNHMWTFESSNFLFQRNMIESLGISGHVAF